MTKKQTTSSRPSSEGLRHSKRYILLGILLGVLIIGGTVVWKYLEWRQPIDQLESANADLKPIFTQLTERYSGRIKDSYYRNECTESSEKYGKGNITCGPVGVIYLKEDISRNEAKDIVRKIVLNNTKFDNQVYGKALSDNQDNSDEIYTKFVHKSSKSECLLNHAQDNTYYLTCRQHVPDFLPGYTIEQ